MAGVRIGGRAFIPTCSPPFGALEGSGGDGDANVYRACVGNPAGDPSLYSDFNDGAVTSERVTNAVLSPNRSRILFEIANATTGLFEIWVTDNIPGSSATLVLSHATRNYMMPWWHPDSDQFVCVLGGTGGAVSGGDIQKSSVSSPGTVTTLKSAGGGSSPYRPQFNNDGTRVAYLFDTDVGGTGELRVMDDDGSNDGSIDSAVKYRFQGGQFCWSNDGTMIAYDDGASGSNIAYVIQADGTGRTQINANGDAAGADARVSDRAWPPDDSYVVFSSNLALGVGYNPIRAELDGSTTTDLNASHGAWAQDYFRQTLVADSRIWFINSQTQLGSVALDGTDYVNYLTIDGVILSVFATGDGWYYN